MTKLEDVTAAAAAYADTVKQETQDAMLDQVISLQNQLLDLQLEYADYVASHPDPVAPTLFGANFGSSPDTSRYPADVPVARLYLKGGVLVPDITKDTGFAKA